MMKRFLNIAATLAGLGTLAVIIMFSLLPRMDHWGARDEEVAVPLPGDQLVASPRISYTRAIAIDAAPEEVYPWLVQLGADRGGLYSYTWFETYVLQCPMSNADRIYEEWQNLTVGDQVKMCPDPNVPPAFEVALIERDRALVLGHQENGTWSDVWQFVLLPQPDGTTHLLLRSRDAKEGWLWDIIRPGEFIMVRGMLVGIKERAEGTAD